MDLKQFEFFKACADYGSFGKAAEALFTTQANMSKVICKLEEEIGYRLFDRNKAGVKLTDTGKAAYASAAEILEKASAIASLQYAGGQSCLRVASVYDFEFSRKYASFIAQQVSNMRFAFYTGSTEKIMEHIECGRAELGFLYSDTCHHSSLNYLLHKKSLELHKLGEASLCLSLGKSSPLYGSRTLTLEQLQDQRLICFEDDLLAQKNFHIDKLAKELNIESNISGAVVTNSDAFLKNMLLETDRAYLHYAYEPCVCPSAHPFMTLPVGCSENRIDWCCITKKDFAVTPTAKAFLHYLKVDFSRNRQKANDSS